MKTAGHDKQQMINVLVLLSIVDPIDGATDTTQDDCNAPAQQVAG